VKVGLGAMFFTVMSFWKRKRPIQIEILNVYMLIKKKKRLTSDELDVP